MRRPVAYTYDYTYGTVPEWSLSKQTDIVGWSGYCQVAFYQRDKKPCWHWSHLDPRQGGVSGPLHSRLAIPNPFHPPSCFLSLSLLRSLSLSFHRRSFWSFGHRLVLWPPSLPLKTSIIVRNLVDQYPSSSSSPSATALNVLQRLDVHSFGRVVKDVDLTSIHSFSGLGLVLLDLHLPIWWTTVNLIDPSVRLREEISESIYISIYRGRNILLASPWKFDILQWFEEKEDSILQVRVFTLGEWRLVKTRAQNQRWPRVTRSRNTAHPPSLVLIQGPRTYTCDPSHPPGHTDINNAYTQTFSLRQHHRTHAIT